MPPSARLVNEARETRLDGCAASWRWRLGARRRAARASSSGLSRTATGTPEYDLRADVGRAGRRASRHHRGDRNDGGAHPGAPQPGHSRRAEHRLPFERPPTRGPTSRGPYIVFFPVPWVKFISLRERVRRPRGACGTSMRMFRGPIPHPDRKIPPSVILSAPLLVLARLINGSDDRAEPGRSTRRHRQDPSPRFDWSSGASCSRPRAARLSIASGATCALSYWLDRCT